MTTATDEVEDNILRVAAKTSTQELAQAISHAVYDGRKPILRAVGAGAVNQAVKGLILAQGYVSQRGLVLSFRPGFVTVEMDKRDTSAIVFHVLTS